MTHERYTRNVYSYPRRFSSRVVERMPDFPNLETDEFNREFRGLHWARPSTSKTGHSWRTRRIATACQDRKRPRCDYM